MPVNGVGKGGQKPPADHNPDTKQDESAGRGGNPGDAFVRDGASKPGQRPGAPTSMAARPTSPSGSPDGGGARTVFGDDIRERPFTRSEKDELIRRLTAAILEADKGKQHLQKVQYRDEFSTRRILETALGMICDRFIAEKKAEGKTPTEKEILTCLRRAYKEIAGKSPDKWNNEIEHLIKPFTACIEENAEGLRLVGTKRSKSKTRKSSTRGSKTAAANPKPHWLSHIETLPGATPDGRRFLPYAGGDLGNFITPLLPTDKDDLERFKFEFSQFTGISLQAALNWGLIRPRPGKKDDDVWKELIEQAKEEGRLFDFVLDHRPEHREAQAWKTRVQEAKDTGALEELAFEIKPEKISRGDWELYTDYAVRNGHPEDVSVEPKKGKALDAVVPVYNFLSAYAQERGLAIDIWEYLAAIYPLIRELVSTTDAEGNISLEIPSGILGELSFDRWGYSTLAQRVMQEQLATSVLPGTLYGHAQKDTDTPAFWNIRRYVTPLAAGSGGDERQLYLFWGGILRIIHALDRTVGISGFSGEALTAQPEPADTRFRLNFADDSLLYATDEQARQSGKERKLATRIQNGNYDTLLELSHHYVRNLSILSEMDMVSELSFSTLEENVSLEELAQTQMDFESREPEYRAEAVGIQPPGIHSSDEVHAFYRYLHETTEELIFATRARGTIDSRAGPLEFITANRPSPSIVEANGDAVLFVNDLFERAIAESWDTPRIENAIRMRVFVGHAVARGYLQAEEITDADAVNRATAHFWTGSASSRSAASIDFVKLEQEHEAIGMSDATGDVRGRKQRESYDVLVRGPVLPGRRLAPHWTEQWMRFARERGIAEGEARTAVVVMSDYFNIARGFLIDFDRGTLRAMIERRFHGRDYDARELVYDAVTTFFPRIGVADGIRRASIATEEERELVSRLAEHAFQSYLDSFPRERSLDPKIPFDPEVLQYFVALACSPHHNVNRRAVLALTRTKIETYNHSKSAPAISTADGFERFGTTGLLEQRLHGFVSRWLAQPGNEDAQINRHRVWNAYFGLASHVRDGRPIDGDTLERALANANQTADAKPDDAKLLRSFVANETRAIAKLAGLADDPKHGIVPFVRNMYEARFITDATLRAFAHTYISQRFTQAMPLDPDRTVRNLTSGSIGPHGVILNKMPGFYRTLLLRWMEERESAFREVVENVKEALDVVASPPPPPMTQDELLSRAATLAGIQDFDEAREADENVSLMRELAHGTPPGERLDAFAQRLFDSDKARAAREAHRAKIEKQNAQVKAWADAAASLAAQSAALYSGWQGMAEDAGAIHAMEASALTTFSGALDQRFDSFVELAAEASSARATVDSAQAANAALGENALYPDAPERIEANLNKASQELAKLEAEFGKAQNAVAARDEELKSERLAAEAAKEHEALLAEAERAKAEIEKGIKAIEEQTNEVSEVRAYIDELSSASIASDLEKISAFTRLGLISARADKLPSAIKSTEEVLAQALDGDDTKLSSVLERLYDAAAEADGPQRERLEQEIDTLETLEERARTMLTKAPAFRASVEELRNILASGLDALERELPIAHAAGFPEPIEREAGAQEFQFLPNGKHADRARAAIAPITKGAVLSAAFGGGSFMLDETHVDAARTWLASERGEPFKFVDIFGKRLTLPAGERGVRLASPSELPEGHAFKQMLEALEHIASSEFATTRLLETLARPSNQGLLRDLLAELATIEGEVTKGEALAAVSFWTMTHRARLTADLGERTVAKIFSSEESGETREPSAATTNAPRIAPKSFEAARNRTLQGKATLLAHPEMGSVFAEQRDGSFANGWADVAEVESRREGEPIRVFSARDNQWVTVNPLSIQTPGYFITHDIEKHLYARLQYQILADPSLTNLAYVFHNQRMEHVRELSDSLLYPIAFTPKGSEQPFTLHDLQDFAVEIYRAAAEGRNKADAIMALTPQDEEVAKAMPETAKVSPLRIYGILQAGSRGDPLMRNAATLMRLFPDLAGLTTITTLLYAQNEDIDSSKAWRETVNQVITLARKDKDEARAAYLKGFLHGVSGLRSGMKEAIRPGMTLARYLTGRDDPWNEDKTWSDYPPAERLALKAPTFARVTSEFADWYLSERELAHTNTDVTTSGVDNDNDITFLKQHPEFKQALAVAFCLIAELPPEQQGLIETFFADSGPWSAPNAVSAFVDMITEPRMLRAIYDAISKPSRFDRRKTYALRMTGVAEPWLPSIKSTPPVAKVEPATAPEDGEYTVAQHLLQAEPYAEFLSNPQIQYVKITPRSGSPVTFVTDTQALREAVEARVWKHGKPTIFKALDSLKGSWVDVPVAGPLQMSDIKVSGRGVVNSRYVRTMYLIYNNPGLLPLGRILQSVAPGSDREYFYSNLINEAAQSDVMPSAEGLKRIQDRALQFEAILAHPEQQQAAGMAFFAKPDAELTSRFPEFGLITGTAMITVYEGLASHAGATVMKVLERMPELAPAVLFELMIGQSGDEEAEAALDVFFGNISREKLPLPAGKRKELFSEFIELYARHRKASLSGVRATERTEGLSESLIIYDPTQPETMTPIEKLNLFAPEADKVRPETWDTLIGQMPSHSPEIRAAKNHAEELAQRHPELRKALALHLWMIPLVNPKVRDEIAQKFKTSVTQEPDPVKQAVNFVELFTDPQYLFAMRTALQQTVPDTEITFAEFLTGESAPWLPAPLSSASASEHVPSQSAPAKTDEDAYTPEEHRSNAEIFAERLRNAQTGVVSVQLKDGTVAKVTTDLALMNKTIDAMKKGDDTRSFDAHVEHRGAVRLTSRDIVRAKEISFILTPTDDRLLDLLCYRIYSSDQYRELGRELSRANTMTVSHGDPAYQRFLEDLLLPIARTPYGQTPPYTLAEAQDRAVRASEFLRSEQGDTVRRIMALYPSRDALRIFPEIKTFSSVWKFELMEALMKGELTALPENPWTVQFLFVFRTMEEHLPKKLIREMNELVETGRGQRPKEVRRKFVKMLEHYRDTIRATLREEMIPGLTFMRFFTGRDNLRNPGSRSVTWDDYTPAERLHFLVPEFQAVHQHHWTTLNEGAQEKTPPPFAAGYIAFARANPSFQKACAALLSIAGQEIERDVRDTIIDLGRRLADPNLPDIAKQEDFTGTLTEPSFHAALRDVLRDNKAIVRESGQPVKTNLSVAEHLTGMTEPWLPKTASAEQHAASAVTSAHAAVPADGDVAVTTPPSDIPDRATRLGWAEGIDRMLENDDFGLMIIGKNEELVETIAQELRDGRRDLLSHWNAFSDKTLITATDVQVARSRIASYQSGLTKEAPEIPLYSAVGKTARNRLETVPQDASIRTIEPSSRYLTALSLLGYVLRKDQYTHLHRLMVRVQQETDPAVKTQLARFLMQLLMPLANARETRKTTGHIPYAISEADYVAKRVLTLLDMNSYAARSMKKFLFDVPHPELVAILPELAHIGSVGMADIAKQLMQDQTESSLASKAPEGLVVFAVIINACPSLPLSVSKLFIAMISDAKKKEQKWPQLIEKVKRYREVIRRDLANRRLGDISFAYHLTGLEQPWSVDRMTSISADERSRLIRAANPATESSEEGSYAQFDENSGKKTKGGSGEGSPSGAASPAPAAPAAPALPTPPSGAHAAHRPSFAGANRFVDLAELNRTGIRANTPTYRGNLTELPSSALPSGFVPGTSETLMHSAQYAYTNTSAAVSFAAMAPMTAMVPL